LGFEFIAAPVVGMESAGHPARPNVIAVISMATADSDQKDNHDGYNNADKDSTE